MAIIKQHQGVVVVNAVKTLEFEVETTSPMAAAVLKENFPPGKVVRFFKNDICVESVSATKKKKDKSFRFSVKSKMVSQ